MLFLLYYNIFDKSQNKNIQKNTKEKNNFSTKTNKNIIYLSKFLFEKKFFISNK
jgi:hypothetical protein